MRAMTNDDSGPYRETAVAYFQAGWTEPLPLPPRAKANPPKGFTGWQTAPSFADVYSWAEGPEGAGNIALRLPDHIIGLDVDAYPGQVGADTVAAKLAAWGELPRTWRSTSREDPSSGIYLYRVPPGMRWPGQLGPDVEIIQRRHRYAVVSPSIHPEGRVYRWVTPEGLTSTVPPDPDALPLLPDSWVAELTGGREAGEAPARNDLGSTESSAWLVGRADMAAPVCRRVEHVSVTAHTELPRAGSVHDATMAVVMRLVALAGQGHTGVIRELGAVRSLFLALVTVPGREHRRTMDEAEGEWARLLVGAVNRISADPAIPTVPVGVDPCVNPFAGILDVDRLADVSRETSPPSQPTADVLPLPVPAPPLITGEPARSTWALVDLTAVLTGIDDESEKPSMLRRADGASLLYRGELNGLIGESESGKTWVALEACRQVIAEGGVVHYYDFEDSPRGITKRTAALGLPIEELLPGGRFGYANPDESLTGQVAWTDLAAQLASHPDMIVIDGYNAAMSTQGLSFKDNDDVTKFGRLLLRMARDSGAAVVTIDHLPKDRDNRGKGGIGAQAKRAAVTGAEIVVEIDGEAYPAPGKTGVMRLTVDKDKRGWVREQAESGHLGMVTMTSDPVTHAVSMTINAPATSVASAATTGDDFSTDYAVMGRISRLLLGAAPERMSGAAIERAIVGRGGTRVAVRAGMHELVRMGYVDTVAGKRQATMFGHVNLFVAAAVEQAEAFDSLLPGQQLLPEGPDE